MTFSKYDIFLIKCARQDPHALIEAGSNALNVTRIRGSLVVLTVILGFFSGAYGTFVVYNNIIGSFLFGGVLGLMIYILDGAILSYSRKAPFYIVLTRFILTLAMSLLFSSLVSVGFFADKIKELQSKEIIAGIDTIQLKYNTQINNLQDILASKEAIVQTKEKAFLDEITGTSIIGATGKRGYGKIGRMKEAAHTKEVANFKKYKKEVDQRILELDSKMTQEIELVTSSQAKGILGSLIVLFTKGSNWLHFWMLVFHIIFMGFDLSPLLIKLTPSRGMKLYHKMIHRREKNIYKAYKATSNLDVELQKMNRHSQFKKAILDLQNINSLNLIIAQDKYTENSIDRLMSIANTEIEAKKAVEKLNLDPSEKAKYLQATESFFTSSVENLQAITSNHRQRAYKQA